MKMQQQSLNMNATFDVSSVHYHNLYKAIINFIIMPYVVKIAK